MQKKKKHRLTFYMPRTTFIRRIIRSEIFTSLTMICKPLRENFFFQIEYCIRFSGRFGYIRLRLVDQIMIGSAIVNPHNN